MTHKYLTGMAYAALLTVLGFMPVVSAAVEAMVITSGCQGKVQSYQVGY